MFVTHLYMIHWWKVLIIVTVVFTASVLSNENHYPLKVNPITPLTTTEHEIQGQRPKPKINTLKGEVEVKPEHVDELNEMISRYLLTFEIKKRGIKDHLLKTMEIMKLLMALSWIRTLKPDPNLVTLEETDLETLSNTIENKLKIDNIHFPVVDAIIAYSMEIEPKMTEAFQKKRKHLEDFEEIFQKHIKSATDAKNEIDADHLKSSWKEVFYNLNQINDNLVVHRMAHRMYIQSYVLTFLPAREQKVEKITLVSTDQKRSKKFRVPSTKGMDIFSDILLGDPEEKNKIILNARISRYMTFFEEERKANSDTNLKQSMNVVKNLMILGWIEKLNPPDIFLLPEHRSKNKDEVVTNLVHININQPVSDAILLYTKEKEETIRNSFEKQKSRLMEDYEKVKSQIREVPSHQQSEDMNRIENEVNDLQDLLLGHDIAKLFYLHSYEDNFAKEKSETLEIKSSRGNESKSFKITPINLLAFYKKPIFD